MHSNFLAIANCKGLAKTFGVRECSNLLQYLNMIKIMQNNNKTNTKQKREICSVIMISMNTTLPPSLNGIQKKIKKTYAFIDDAYH